MHRPPGVATLILRRSDLRFFLFESSGRVLEKIPLLEPRGVTQGVEKNSFSPQKIQKIYVRL